MKTIIRMAETDKEIQNCYDTMRQLRPGIKRDEFLSRVKEQKQTGYKLTYVEEAGQVVSVAGFRVSQNLAWGKFVYVDDLVTDELNRSKQFGDKLIDWLIAYAKENSCKEFHLDSGVQRFSAHRFYFRKKLIISGHHFGRILTDEK